MLLKVYKSRVWVLLFMLLPFIGNAQIPGLPAGWEFTENPTSGVYAIQTTVGYDGVDALAVDDWVGAFYMDDGVMECAGAVQWDGTNNVAVVVFGNDTLAGDKNGFSDGEAIHWMIYRDASGTEEEVCTMPEFLWANGALEEIEMFTGCEEPCQTIELQTGFQFVSSYVAAPDPDMEVVMTDVLDNLEFARNSVGAQLEFFFGFWVNGIGDWVNTEGYLVSMTGDDVLEICGAPVDPQTPIDLSTGFQFVGYLDDTPQDALIAFDGVLDNLEFVRDSDGGQLEFFFGFWVNGIGDLNPGEGYLVSMNADDQLIYPATDGMNASPSSQAVPASKVSRGVHWPTVQGDPSDILWKVYIFGASLNGTTLEADDEVAIYDGDLLVGSLVLPGTPPGGPVPGFDINAWHTLNSGPGFEIGNEYTIKCWDASEDVESTGFTVTFLAGETAVFPDGNLTSAANLEFTAEQAAAPELLSATPGLESVDLEWTPIPEQDTDGVHWPTVQGDPSDILWKVYIFSADLNGSTLEANDEVAIFDGDLLVGSLVLPGTPPGGPVPGFDINAWHTLNSGPGFVIGNDYTFKCWDASEDLESTGFTITFLAGDTPVFPDGNLTSAGNLEFTAAAQYVPTFNIYVDGALTVEGVEGNTYTVDGLTGGQEYCFTVTQILEDETESGQSNELCAIPEGGCEDAVINNFPAGQDDVCQGTELVIDFSGVEILNAVEVEWMVEPMEAGEYVGTDFVLNTDYVGEVTLTLMAYAQEPCADAEASLSFMVNALPEVTLMAYEPVCEGSEAFELYGGMPEGGMYYVDGEEATMFDPAVAGTYMLEYMYTDENGCSASAMGEIVVNALPEVTLMAYEPVCEGSEAFELYGGMPEGGMYYVDGEEATMFDPAVAGTYMLEYMYTDENGCSASAMGEIVVNALPEVTLMAYEPVCEGSEAFELYGGMPEGGMYYVDGEEATMFDPAVAGTYMLEYMYTDDNGCTNSAMGEIVVWELPVVTCPDNMNYTLDELPVTLMGATPEGGVYSGEGVEEGDFFVEEEGVYEITYTYVDGNGCENFCTFTITVGIVPCDDAVINNFPEGQDDVCQGTELVIDFSGVEILNAVEVVWMVEPMEAGEYVGTDFVLNTDYVGEVTLTLMAYAQEPCADAEASLSFMVNALPEVTLMAYEPVCEGSEAFELYGGMPEGGMYYVDGEEATMFDPAVAGTYMLEYMYTDENGCSASAMGEIVVNALPEVTLMAYEPVCEGSEAFELYGGMPEGGMYYVDGEEATMFDPAVAGTYMLEYMYTDENGCSASAMGEIVVNALPEVTLMAYEPVCEGSEAFDLYGGMPEGGMYYVDGEEATMFDPAVAGTYMLEYMYTDENGCSASAMGEIVVNPAPVAECPEFEAVCEGSEYIMFPEVEGGVYTDMDDMVVEGFDPMMAGEYMFTLTVTNEFGCVASCEFMITVNALPTLEYEYSSLEICIGETVDVTVTGPEDGAYPYEVEYTVNGMTMTDVIEDSYLEYPFTPDMAGVWEFVIVSITDANGCMSMPNDVFELNVLPLTEITMQPMSVEVLWSEAAEFSVEAENATGYQWYFNGEMIDGATDATYAIESAMLDDAGEYYVMVMGECGDVMSDVVTLTVLPWTQVIDFAGPINGMSTYLDLSTTEDDLATLFEEIIDWVTLVEFKMPNQTWSPLNASFAFDEEQGAKVNLNDGYPTSIEVMGYPTLGTDVELGAGVNYIPVWAQSVVLADDVLGPLGDDLKWAFSMDYAGIYAPQYGLFTLEYLVPGSSYLVEMNNGATVSFDVPAVDAAPGYADLPRNITSWDDATLTGTQHNIFILANALSQLQVGDVIGAFNEYDQMTGMAEVTSTRDNMALRTFGDDPLTDRAEGFVEGDMMTIKVWRNGEEMIAQATFDANMPNSNIFAEDGVSTITNLKVGATSINDLTAGLEASLYPNPATDVVNIETNFDINNIKVVNYVGQIVLDQNINQTNFQINTSDYRSGMYFVQIENSEGVVITKRLTIK